jgi:deoxyribose-phosphate aldolase
MKRAVPASVARFLDHAVLKPQQTDADLEAAASMCITRGVGCLCVRSGDVARAGRLLAGSDVVLATTIGFPHGSEATAAKVAEARAAIAAGARELDMVIQIGALLSGRPADVEADIAAVVSVARPQAVLVKVILEVCFLSPDQIRAVCRIARAAAADFVKTSTGFGPGGATREAVALMLESVGERLGVKASGGIRSWQDCRAYLEMGCTRIGVGDAATILDQAAAAGEASWKR